MGNIRGLFPKSNQNKIPVLRELAIDENRDILALTETHLNNDILNAEISMQNYTIYTADRIARSHGGVALYINHD